ncbi:MAG: hypothetical protein AAGA65_31470 [Actinomycetota bacterium]
MSDFEERFDEILAIGARDWVNLNLAEVDGDSLHLTLEYFTEPINGVRVDPGRILVNVSGLERDNR